MANMAIEAFSDSSIFRVILRCICLLMGIMFAFVRNAFYFAMFTRVGVKCYLQLDVFENALGVLSAVKLSLKRERSRTEIFSEIGKKKLSGDVGIGR